MRWGEAREREVLLAVPRRQKEVPTLAEFAPRFLDGHARANRQKPGGINHKEVVLRVHLEPALGSKKLDALSNEDVQRLKCHLEAKSPKTVNNVLTVLNTMLKKAVEWGVIERMPCAIRLLKTIGVRRFLRLRRVSAAGRSGSRSARGTSRSCCSEGTRGCGPAKCGRWRGAT